MIDTDMLPDARDRLQSVIVPPSGPIGATIAFIGQSPGEEEEIGVQPFIGAAGQFLGRCMSQVGLVKSQYLFYNTFQQRPPDGDISYFFEDKKTMTRLTWEGREHVDNLRSWLEELDPKPNLLVALGREAMLVLTGHKRVWKWRGSVLPCTLIPGYKVYVTLHPSGVLRLIGEPEEKLQGEKKELANNALPLFLRDLERCRIQCETPDIVYPERKFDIDLDYSALVGKLEFINKENLDCSVDIETIYGLEGPIGWCIGFSPHPAYAFVIPLIRSQSFAWPINQEAHLIQLISKYFLNSIAQKIFQNGAYDLSILGRYYGLRVAQGTYQDTMWLHHATFPQMKKSLETLVSMYTWEPYYKDEGKVQLGKRTGDAAEFKYNAKDCCCTKELFPILKQNALEAGTWDGYLRSMSYMPSLLAMMLRGVNIDLTLKERLHEEFSAKAAFHQVELNRLEGETINLNSSQQVIALLYYKHQFKEQRQWKKPGRPLTADKDALNKLKRLYPVEPSLDHILEFKKYSKLVSTYTEMTTDTDGRMRTSYGFVSTWRLYSSSSAFGTGGNLQNIPVRTDEGRAIRRLFIPDEMPKYPEHLWSLIVNHVKQVAGPTVASALSNGKMLMIASDLSQAEARYVAWDSEDTQMIEDFLAGIDVHWEITKKIFAMPSNIEYRKKEATYYDAVYTGEEALHHNFRQMGKTIKHAVNYKMGPRQLQTTLAREGFVLEYSTCKRILEEISMALPLLTKWQEDIFEEVKSTRVLTSAIGRKRIFHGRMDDNLWRAACAFKPQNTVGEILENAIQVIFDTAPWIELLLNVHDEVVAQIPPHRLLEAIPIMQSALEYPLEIHGRELIIPCDFKCGPSWADLEEFKPNFNIELPRELLEWKGTRS